jgi:hypothetical protein
MKVNDDEDEGERGRYEDIRRRTTVNEDSVDDDFEVEGTAKLSINPPGPGLDYLQAHLQSLSSSRAVM